MPLSDTIFHLYSDEHKNETKGRVYCEDCVKYVSDRTRHFQSESHIQRSQQTLQQSNQLNQQSNHQSNQLNQFGLEVLKNCS